MRDVGRALDDCRRLGLQLDHGGERDVLPRLGLNRELTDVLLREEALGDLAEHPDRRGDRGKEQDEHERPGAQTTVEQPRIAGGDAIERPLERDCAGARRRGRALGAGVP